MSRVRLIHWNEIDARDCVAALQAEGYEVEYDLLRDPAGIRAIGRNKPDAVVIDLSQRLAKGRDLAIWLRRQKPTRYLPLVLVGGMPDKVAKIKDLLPDVVYSDWKHLGSRLQQAIAKPPKNPVVPDSMLAGYSGTPLPKKLGIKPASVVALVGGPADFDRTLGPLPGDVELRPSGRGRRDLTICFVRSRKDLDRRIDKLVEVSEQGNVWIAWPKKASSMSTDLTQTYVRQKGLDAGLVDFKICAIDDTWSGLCFALRRR